MARKKVVDIVKELIAAFIKENDLELIDIEFLKEGKDWYLRVYIDKEAGVSLDDCQLVSEYLSNKLDEADPIEQSYYLEVSSPGLGRPLKTEKDFKRNINQLIEVSLYEPVNGKKIVEGELVEYKESTIAIKINENQMMVLERSNIAKAKPVLNI